jgi:hypothetical protein
VGRKMSYDVEVIERDDGKVEIDISFTPVHPLKTVSATFEKPEGVDEKEWIQGMKEIFEEVFGDANGDIIE